MTTKKTRRNETKKDVFHSFQMDLWQSIADAFYIVNLLAKYFVVAFSHLIFNWWMCRTHLHINSMEEKVEEKFVGVNLPCTPSNTDQWRRCCCCFIYKCVRALVCVYVWFDLFVMSIQLPPLLLLLPRNKTAATTAQIYLSILMLDSLGFAIAHNSNMLCVWLLLWHALHQNLFCCCCCCCYFAHIPFSYYAPKKWELCVCIWCFFFVGFSTLCFYPEEAEIKYNAPHHLPFAFEVFFSLFCPRDSELRPVTMLLTISISINTAKYEWKSERAREGAWKRKAEHIQCTCMNVWRMYGENAKPFGFFHLHTPYPTRI